jgi:hypothetical protein
VLLGEKETEDLEQAIRIRFGGKRVSDRRVERLVHGLLSSGNDYMDTDGTVYMSDAAWKDALAETRVHTAGAGRGL